MSKIKITTDGKRPHEPPLEILYAWCSKDANGKEGIVGGTSIDGNPLPLVGGPRHLNNLIKWRSSIQEIANATQTKIVLRKFSTSEIIDEVDFD